MTKVFEPRPADRFDSPPATANERAALRGAIVRQNLELAECSHRVTCPCGRNLVAVLAAFRCYTCGLYFCDPCAQRHFGVSERPSYLEEGD